MTKAIICGAGQYTQNLLGRLGERWRITLIDTAADRLNLLMSRYDQVVKVIQGDASSPVVLEDAGIGETDYLLALTHNDKVNLAAAHFAREKGIRHILSVVRDFLYNEQFLNIDVHTIFPGNLVGGGIYHYLQDPRIRVSPVSKGQGEMVEFEVSRDNWIVGMPLNVLENQEWRLAGLFRGERMILPGTDESIREGDSLILMGKRNFFRSVCSVLACGHMPFPMIWGRGAMITLDDDDDEKAFIPMIEECEYLFPNIRINHVTILRHEKAPDPSEFLTQWMDRWNVGIRRTERRPAEEISRISREENIGLVIIRPFEKSFFKSFTRAETISLAHQLPCPLFIARHSYPYERILVPFNATPMSERALETAIELAGIFGAELDAAVVQPPDFIHDEGPEFNPEHLFRKVRNFSHLYKIQIGEIVLQGNPVRELTALAADYQLMIVGSTSKDKEFLTPHVGELLTERTPCSVLIIARD